MESGAAVRGGGGIWSSYQALLKSRARSDSDDLSSVSSFAKKPQLKPETLLKTSEF